MRLNKKYSLPMIVMMAISATVGTSVLISFGQVGFQTGYNPLLMIIAWIIGALLTMSEALLMAEPAVSFAENGSAYHWLKKAKWNSISFWFGWVLILMVSATAIASSTLALGNIIATLAGINNAWLAKLFGISILIFLALLQIFIKSVSGLSQIFFTILKSLPIVLLLIIAIFYGTNDNFKQEIIAKNLSKIFFGTYLLLPGIAMTMFAFSGIESITYVSGEIKNPRKNIPKALILATLIIVTIYVVLAIVLLTINKPCNWLKDGNFSNVWHYAIINNPKIPIIFSKLFSVFMIFIFVGSLNAFLLYQSRVIFKMSEEKDLFKFFQKANKRTNIPYVAMIFLVIISMLYSLWHELNSVSAYFILSTALLKLIIVSVFIYLRLRHQNYKRMYNNYIFWILVVLNYLSGIVSFSGSFLAIYFSAINKNNMWELWNSLIVLAIMFSGFPMYYLLKFLKILISNKNRNNKDSITSTICEK